MPDVLTAAQAAGVLAVFVALFGLLPFWWALLVVGVLAVAVATAVEHIVRGRPAARSGGRSGPITAGGE